MAHPTEGAVDVPVSYDDDDSAAAAIAGLNLDDEEQDDEDSAEEGDLEEGALDSEDEADEGEEPQAAIPAPVSLNAEEKAKFSQLPPEAQRLILDVESRRNAQVQEATTKASNAQREADARAAAADAQAKAQYAQQLHQFVSGFAPQPPDPALAYADPAAYIAQEAQFKAQSAQFNQLVQQITAVGSEAAQEMDQTFLAQRDRELMSHPKIANPETRETFLQGVFALAEEAGFDPKHIIQNATGHEVLAIAKIYERLSVAEEKAAKYDKALSRQMQKVRAGKPKTLRPGAAQSDGSGNQRAYSEATQRLKSSGRIEDATAALAQILG